MRIASAIQNGPGSDDEIRALLTDDQGSPTNEEVRGYRVRWQRKRLRRFGNKVPAELAGLAATLDADTSVPKPTGSQLELEDTGSTGGFGWSGGPKSPLTTEELNALTAEQLLAFLRDYQPERESFDSPTPAGLASALADRIRRTPSFGAMLAALLPAAGVEHTYVRGILEGLVGAATDGLEISWSDVLPLVEWVAQWPIDGIEQAQDFDYGDANWRWAQREASKLVGLAGSKNLAKESDASALWRAAEQLLASDASDINIGVCREKLTPALTLRGGRLNAFQANERC